MSPGSESEVNQCRGLTKSEFALEHQRQHENTTSSVCQCCAGLQFLLQAKLGLLRLAPSEATWPPCLLLTWAFWIEAAQRGNNNIVAASLNTLRTNGEKWSLQNMSTFKTRCFHCFQCSQIHFTCFKKITWLYSLIQYLVWTLVKVDISCRPCI